MIRTIISQRTGKNAAMVPPLQMIIEDLSSEELAKFHAQRARYERNWSWLEAHASEVYSHRGKYICIAGQELCVGDTVEEVLAWAKVTHPEDDGRLLRHIPKERGARIYAHQWPLVSL